MRLHREMYLRQIKSFKELICRARTQIRPSRHPTFGAQPCELSGGMTVSFVEDKGSMENHGRQWLLVDVKRDSCSKSTTRAGETTCSIRRDVMMR